MLIVLSEAELIRHVVRFDDDNISDFQVLSTELGDSKVLCVGAMRSVLEQILEAMEAIIEVATGFTESSALCERLTVALNGKLGASNHQLLESTNSSKRDLMCLLIEKKLVSLLNDPDLS